MDLALLRGELEKSFDLSELEELSRTALGYGPEVVAGATRTAFATALVAHCTKEDALDALCDAIVSYRGALPARVAESRRNDAAGEVALDVGARLSHYTIHRCLGTGARGSVYAATAGERLVRIKLLRRAFRETPRVLARAFATARLAGSLGHPGLPSNVSTGDVGGGRVGVATSLADGTTLDRWRRERAAIRFRRAWPILRGILEPLAALHQRHLVHGDLRSTNVVIETVPVEPENEHVVLVDAGCHHLGAGDGCLSPEQLVGHSATPATDVYAFGLILYELLAGRPAFVASRRAEVLLAHLERLPDPLSFAAPSGWVTDELDEFVLALLDKDPSARPHDATAVLEHLETLVQLSVGRQSRLPPGELDHRVHALLSNPMDEVTAGVLEAAVLQGEDPAKIANAFEMAVDILPDDAPGREARRRLWTRAAAMYERSASQVGHAEKLYERLLADDPDDEPTRAALERVHRFLGHYDRLVELLLAQIDRSTSAAERARALAKLGGVLVAELDDRDQALVVYTRALCELPGEVRFAQEVEQLAGSDAALWTEVLSTCAETANSDLPTDKRARLLAWMAKWYQARLGRADLALQCYEAMLQADPANDLALREMASLLRAAQQWPELAAALSRRADVAVSPAAARDLRVQAAEIYERRLGDVAEAIRRYDQVLADDPAHEAASENLVRLYEQQDRWHSVVRVLCDRADAVGGELRWSLLCRAAELADKKLEDPVAATRRYEAILEESPSHLEALRGIERLYERAGRTLDLVGVIERQLASAVTPNQRAMMWRRIAELYAREFYDHKKAAEALENALEVDPTAVDAYEALATHYRATSQWEDLERTLERWTENERDPARRVGLLRDLGELCETKLSLPDRASAAYERILEADPKDRLALDAVARMRAEAGAWDDAIERYRVALANNPHDEKAGRGLRDAYIAQGNPERAVSLLEHTIARSDEPEERGPLLVELSRLFLEQLRDRGRADAASASALGETPDDPRAHLVRGDVLYALERYVEAAQHYERATAPDAHLNVDETVRALAREVDSLARSGSAKSAIEPAERLLALAPNDVSALRMASELAFEHGSPERAYELAYELVESHEGELGGDELAAAQLRRGESARKLGKLDEAERALEEAAFLGDGTAALDALSRVYEARRDWPAARSVLERALDRAPDSERLDRLIALGDLATTLDDTHGASEYFLAALTERPNDRRAQLKLLQLYSEGRDWDRLLEVLLRAAASADVDSTRARYKVTAARVLLEELDEPKRGLELLDEAIELDPSLTEAANRAIELHRKQEDLDGALRILTSQIAYAARRDDRARALALSYELADLHLGNLEVDEAVAVYEAALRLDPNNQRCRELLTELYTSDPQRYLERAVEAHQAALRDDPLRPEPYEGLRQVYESAHHQDGTWCVSQALVVLHRASPEVDEHYARYRRPSPAVATSSLGDDDWKGVIMHPNADPLVTEIFTLLQPAVVAARTKRLDDLLGKGARVDPDKDDGVTKMLRYAARVLGLSLPALVERPDLESALNLLRSRPPAIALGRGASGALPARPAAFAAAAHLCFCRPGLYVRFLLGTPAALKAWLLSAIKLVAPRLPIAPELEGLVQDAQGALDEHLSAAARDRLAEPVTKLFNREALVDLDRWVNAVDFTADRVGLLLCDDLRTAIDLVKASSDKATSVAVAERIKELLRYSVSGPYIRARATIGIAIPATT